MKKYIIISSISLIALVGVGTFVFVNNNDTYQQNTAEPLQVNLQTEQSVPEQDIKTEQEKVEAVPQEDALTEPVSEVTQEPEIIALFDTVANTEGQYLVHDKTTLMSQAGISANDIPIALEVIKTNIYRSNTIDISLCGPPSKTRPAHPDFKTNPVSQLNYCDQYAKSRYGSWQNMLDFFNQNKYF